MKKLPIESALRWAETFAAGCYESSRTPAERNSGLGVTCHACVSLAREVRLLRKALAAGQSNAVTWKAKALQSSRTGLFTQKRTLAQQFFKRT